MPNKRETLSPRQRQLVHHVDRYRMTTPSAVARDIDLPITTVATAKRRLSELVKSGILGRASLYRNRRYHHLQLPALRFLNDQAGQDVNRLLCGPLSEIAKIRAYAMLAFCCFSGEQRYRLTRREFEHGLPELYRPGMPLNYYVERRPDSTILGFLRTDAGAIGRWDRVVRKLRHDIESHWQHRGFRTLIQKNQFEVTIVTPMPAKCERLHQTLASDRKLRPVPLRIVAMPELIHLLAPPVAVPRQ